MIADDGVNGNFRSGDDLTARSAGLGGTMRRIGAIVALALLTACSTSDDFAPSSFRADDVSPTSTSSATVAVAYPRFSDSDPHDWQSNAPWSYAVHGTDVSRYQTSVGWGDARSSGISFAFIK